LGALPDNVRWIVVYDRDQEFDVALDDVETGFSSLSVSWPSACITSS